MILREQNAIGDERYRLLGIELLSNLGHHPTGNRYALAEEVARRNLLRRPPILWWTNRAFFKRRFLYGLGRPHGPVGISLVPVSGPRTRRYALTFQD